MCPSEHKQSNKMADQINIRTYLHMYIHVGLYRKAFVGSKCTNFYGILFIFKNFRLNHICEDKVSQTFKVRIYIYIYILYYKYIIIIYIYKYIIIIYIYIYIYIYMRYTYTYSAYMNNVNIILK